MQLPPGSVAESQKASTISLQNYESPVFLWEAQVQHFADVCRFLGSRGQSVLLKGQGDY